MYKIFNKTDNSKCQILIDKALWGYNDYTPRVEASINYCDDGFCVKFIVFESNPTREKKNHFESVHEDSCVEFFVNFMPNSSEHYINFETNANGMMNVAYRTDRHNFQKLLIEEVEGFNIKTNIFNDYWTVEYKIGFDFISKYYKGFDIEKCEYIKCNLYKCGDKTPHEHYISAFNVGCETPDFHRPEYFEKILLVH